MSRHSSELTDEQWSKIEPLLPKRKPSPKGARKRIEDRRCFEGILWVLRSGARWQDLPLREVEVELGRGKTVAEAVKKIGVTSQYPSPANVLASAAGVIHIIC